MYSEDQIKDVVRKVLQKFNDQREGSLSLNLGEIKISSGFGLYETIDESIEKTKEAQIYWINLPLEKRHEIIEKLRLRLLEHLEIISQKAVLETGLGRADDKIKKNRLVIQKTPGIEFLHPEAFSGDHGLTIMERAPYGLIASITPCTNPTETIINNGIGMIAGGNGVVFNPHPLAKDVSKLTIQIINKSIAENGGPEDLFSTIHNPTIESATKLMSHKDIRLVVVTGGPGVVKAAMSLGKKVIAGGPGNPPVVVDSTCDLAYAASSIILGASLDNNIVCTDEKEVFCEKNVVKDLKKYMNESGAYEVSGYELKKLEKELLVDNHPNKECIGKNANLLLDRIGIRAKNDIRLIMCETEFNHSFVQNEMLMPILPIVAVDTVFEGIEYARKAEHGFGHTASMYSKNIEHLDRMARVINCSIFVKNAPNYAGLGMEGEGYTSFTIASPTGEGLTTVRNFTRERRCTLAKYFRIV